MSNKILKIFFEGGAEKRFMNKPQPQRHMERLQLFLNVYMSTKKR